MKRLMMGTNMTRRRRRTKGDDESDNESDDEYNEEEDTRGRYSLVSLIYSK